MNSRNGPGDMLLSLVIPCYNESNGLFELYARLSTVLRRLAMPIEVLFVNDGSRDDTIDVIHRLQEGDPRIGYVELSRNFGKEAALTAGIDIARGDAVVVLDADLQDPPEYIPDMVAAWRNGYDVVAMRRADRSSDSAFKRWTARAYYRLLGRLSEVDIPQDVGDFRLLSRRAVDALKQLPERNRYMKGLFAWVGFNSIELPYTRDPRFAGSTKMPFLKLLGLGLDGITSFSIMPLRLASAIGSLVAVGALVYGLVKLADTLVYGDPVAGFPTLIIVMTFLGGAQLLAIGLLGEYVGRLLVESKQRPLYLVDTVQLPRLERPLTLRHGMSATVP